MTKPHPAPAQRVMPKTTPANPRASSAALLGDATMLLIEHAGEEYQLRRTRNGKLILTK